MQFNYCLNNEINALPVSLKVEFENFADLIFDEESLIVSIGLVYRNRFLLPFLYWIYGNPARDPWLFAQLTVSPDFYNYSVSVSG